jgi:hypothetical protein
MANDLELKVVQFSRALKKYETRKRYRYIHLACAYWIVLLQVGSLILIFQEPTISLKKCLLSIPLAYILADFFNGLTHMIMDNNTRYQSLFGPFIAVFHLHHAKLKYQTRPLLHVYFYESGFKLWLVVYLFILILLQLFVPLNSIWYLIGAFFAVFSSFAEVSHYLCHNFNKKKGVIAWLQRNRFLLYKPYHLNHHRADNIQYAFLNGVSDFLLNIIARYCYKGYKNHADVHVAYYIKETLKNNPFNEQ